MSRKAFGCFFCQLEHNFAEELAYKPAMYYLYPNIHTFMQSRIDNLQHTVKCLLDEIDAENMASAVTMGEQAIAEGLAAWSKSHDDVDDELAVAELLTSATTSYAYALSTSGMPREGFAITLTVIANMNEHSEELEQTLDLQELLYQLAMTLWKSLSATLSSIEPPQEAEVLDHVRVITVYIGLMMQHYGHILTVAEPDNDLVSTANEVISEIVECVGPLPRRGVTLKIRGQNVPAHDMRAILYDLIARADAIGLIELTE